MKRDPRIDPRPGDILRFGGSLSPLYEVSARKITGVLCITSYHGNGVMQMPTGDWGKWAAAAEVIWTDDGRDTKAEDLPAEIARLQASLEEYNKRLEDANKTLAKLNAEHNELKRKHGLMSYLSIAIQNLTSLLVNSIEDIDDQKETNK